MAADNEKFEPPRSRLSFNILKAPLDRIRRSSSIPGPRALSAHKPIYQIINKSGLFAQNSTEQSEKPYHHDSQHRKAKNDAKAGRKSDHRKRRSEDRYNDEEFLKNGPEELTSLFKPLSMNMSKRRSLVDVERRGRWMFSEIDFENMEGQIITFRARIHTIRRMSAKLVFVVLRQQTITIQAVLEASAPEQDADGKESTGIIIEQMVRSVLHYPPESIVLVKGQIRKSPHKIQNPSIHDAEIAIREIHLISKLEENVPFTVYDADNIGKVSKKETAEDSGSSTESDEIGIVKIEPHRNRDTSSDSSRLNHHKLPQAYRLNNRVIDLRAPVSQSIFRIQSGVTNIFRSYMDAQGFIEIHTPKLQGSATESGASVFEVNYFGRPAYLAQSPQLAKQMSIAADFERVYEVGPVFRAEESNTPRHLTEFTGLDIEMAIEEHYHEALDIIDDMFKTLWKTLYERYSKEIEIISQFYPHEKVLWREKTPRITFLEGIKLLKEDGWTDDLGNTPSEYEDLATRAEIRLGQIVREKYKADYYILDKFPQSARPFYTMPDPNNPKFTNSFDIFMRGQEILSGGQRIHEAKFLEHRMRTMGVKPETMDEYVEGFRWGAPPHAGAGIGLERLVFLFLNLGNIRLASLFPRDPKSLPQRPLALVLRHPEASTTNPPWEDSSKDGLPATQKDFQPLEKLIANYGDAANTSWLDARYSLWRHPSTGAAQGFATSRGHAIAIGPPLCAKSQYPQVISAYLDCLATEHKSLKPMWLMADPSIKEYLGEKFNWRTLSPVAENRIDPRSNSALRDHDIVRKVRHAEKEGVKNFDVPSAAPVPGPLRERIDARTADWKANRKGRQVHLTEIRPWTDQEHRRYYYAAEGSRDGRIHALVVLHQLSPQNGWQVKFSLEFPGAPSGTIESLNIFAMGAIVAEDKEVKTLTYGTGATADLVGGRNIGKKKTAVLKKSYEAISKRLGLRNKSEWRERLGAREDRVYVCYPRGGMGPGGIKAILDFMGGE